VRIVPCQRSGLGTGDADADGLEGDVAIGDTPAWSTPGGNGLECAASSAPKIAHPVKTAVHAATLISRRRLSAAPAC